MAEYSAPSAVEPPPVEVRAGKQGRRKLAAAAQVGLRRRLNTTVAGACGAAAREVEEADGCFELD